MWREVQGHESLGNVVVTARRLIRSVTRYQRQMMHDLEAAAVEFITSTRDNTKGVIMLELRVLIR